MALIRANSNDGGSGSKMWVQHYDSAASVPSTIDSTTVDMYGNVLDFEPKYICMGISWQGTYAMYMSWDKIAGYTRYFQNVYDNENSASLTVSGNTVSFGTMKQYFNKCDIVIIG